MGGRGTRERPDERNPLWRKKRESNKSDGEKGWTRRRERENLYINYCCGSRDNGAL